MNTITFPDGWSGSLGESLWQIILTFLKQDDTIGEELIEWLAEAKIYFDFDEEETCRIIATSIFQKMVIERRFLTRIRIVLKDHIKIDPNIVVVTADELGQ